MSDNNTSNDDAQTPTVTLHVGNQSDEGTNGTDGIDIVDFAGGGGRGYNIILGGSGNDNLVSQGIHDDVFGGSGNDTITLTGHGAWAFGGTGNDTITGSDNTILTERLYGGEGNDTIDGGGGRDYIIGGAGDDQLTGGSGADVFFFSEGHGNDTIHDFNPAEGDRIYLRGFDKTITWDQLQAAMTQVEDDPATDDVDETATVIDLSAWGGGTVTLKGVTMTDLNADMFYLDHLSGTIGGDVLFGGTDDDTMSGGGGPDTFLFWEGHGNDTITDFNAAEGDKIDLTWFDNAITWADLQDAMTDDGTDTVIDMLAHRPAHSEELSTKHVRGRRYSPVMTTSRASRRKREGRVRLRGLPGCGFDLGSLPPTRCSSSSKLQAIFPPSLDRNIACCRRNVKRRVGRAADFSAVAGFSVTRWKHEGFSTPV